MKNLILVLIVLAGTFNITSAQTALTTSTLNTTSPTPAVGASVQLRMYNGNANVLSNTRWVMGLAGPEGVNNDGSHFRLMRYDSAGSFISSVFLANRSTGMLEMYSGFRAASGSGILGTGSGVLNLSFMGFFESDKTTRQGWVGKGSGAHTDISLGSDIGGVSLNPFNGMVTLRNATGSMITYNNTGYAIPTGINRSRGTKLILHEAINASNSNVDLAIGADQVGGNIHGWFSLPTNTTMNYWSFYGGTTMIAKLDGVGTFTSRRIKVTQNDWADFVFEDNYKLPSLNSIEKFIKINKHLPDVPSAQEVVDKGLDLGEMNKILLQKIEELTLHLINQEKELIKVKNALSSLEQRSKFID
ncbi:hypothetical protein [Chitinophaga rhizophila]|uniref:Uncharacterized protein n=1 Tax=Chitinophaga rhizophila TaxID=2866212 RepID=A0ABS7GBI4_9BACT|nr:hypothetical protein [Chitinophaga rhizophila]MBW8683893.1 hypothetical protein [Chitinophaga rhizophila]